MDYRRPADSDLPLISAAIADQQADATRHVAYLSTESAAIAAELAVLEPKGLDGAMAAYEGSEPTGFLALEWDHEPPRAWWHGPFVFGTHNWNRVAEELHARCIQLLPPSVTQHELAADTRHELLAAFASRHGFVTEEGSAVLSRALDPPPAGGTVDALVVSGLKKADRAAVAALHDRLFLGAHRSGDRLDEGSERAVLVARRAGEVVGYVACERQEDGAGYLDFIGVDPDERGRGVGGVLVAAACSLLAERHGCRQVHLTVRESNHAARRLYERLGFTQERLLRPFRRGFTLA